ncbi:hypothetical protein HMI48_10735 [Acidithiobacillus ferrooxidans]|uniref:hypothetical protein n=1 Tax=Acidithiobacillus ferrooxidans TaxID=920 RepID=UPI001C075F02|nr:hypothetical protein [Acidithiobacillus ferrooxidans]MBU2774333.1 hypothetical protein [Acidithiobacillus ferrooxidans]
MGEDRKQPLKPIPDAIQTMVVDTLGGRVQVSWDKESAATPFGQLVFFAEFQKVSGLFDAWVEECPLIYNSPTHPRSAMYWALGISPYWRVTDAMHMSLDYAVMVSVRRFWG